MQIVSFEAPQPEKGKWFSREKAIDALGIDRDRFDLLVRIGVFPKGVLRHGTKQVRWSRKHLAIMLYYVEHPEEFNVPAEPLSTPS